MLGIFCAYMFYIYLQVHLYPMDGKEIVLSQQLVLLLLLIASVLIA